MLVFVASSTQLQRIREVGQVMGPTVGIVLEQFGVTTNEPPTLVHRQSCYSPSMAQIAPTLLLRDQRCNSPISNEQSSLAIGLGSIAIGKGCGDHYALFWAYRRGEEGQWTKDSRNRGTVSGHQTYSLI
ncbi:hypothetical protein VNO80_16336 [Phaseolus coccineus]|uniref:Uncharacterized protein n=1 Tax=Phaseolus coccineus TaxID=3886 RepID=A0AAN9MLW1_PHACN